MDSRLHHSAASLAGVAVVAGLLAGCSGSSSKNPVAPGGGTSDSATFTGIFVSGGDGGTLSLTFSTAAANLAPPAGRGAAPVAGTIVDATGTLTPTNATAVALQGVYDTVADTFHVAGPGYVVSGEFDSLGVYPGVAGTYLGAQGNGLFACFLTGKTPVRSFIGVYINDGFTAGGRWNLLAIDTLVVGAAAPQGGTAADILGFQGTVGPTGTLRPIAISTASGSVTLNAGGTWNTTDNTVSGTWQYADSSIPASDSGTWSGSLAP